MKRNRIKNFITVGVIFIFCINVKHTIFAGSNKNNTTSGEFHTNTSLQNWKNSEIIELLKKGKVISTKPMKEYLKSCGKKASFDGDVYLVELDNGLKAVFKSLPPDDLGDAYAEIAAYEASVILGFPYIPPTVITTIDKKKGSLQLFVETDIDSLSPDVYESALKEVSSDDMDNLKLFYFIFGQWDSGRHNILIIKNKDKTQLIAIDNSGIRNHQRVIYGNLPFVRVAYSDNLQTDDWDKPFPFDQAKVIQNPTPETLRQTFGKIFPESLYQSIQSYELSFRYVIYQNSLWRQYHDGDKEFVISFTDHLPNQTRKSLEALNMSILKKIFACAKGVDFLTPTYLQSIIDRRDQVLHYFHKKKEL